MEVSCKLIERHKIINRGFLIGPYCPIYGIGAILITLLLKHFMANPVLLFIMAIIICGSLEYLTSLFLEKIFHLRWWDYSKRKFNVNGRICLYTVIPFGILGMIIMYIANPFFMDKLKIFNIIQLNNIFYILAPIFIIDNIITIPTIFGIGSTAKIVNLENKEDNTEEITRKIREILLNKSFVQRRLLNAYPMVQAIKIKVKEKIDKTRDEIERQKEILDNKVNAAKDIINIKIKEDKKKIKKEKEN